MGIAASFDVALLQEFRFQLELPDVAPNAESAWFNICAV
jgi:hypothetical protein